MANPEHVEILKQGVEVWNRWRRENTDIRPDLSEATLCDDVLDGTDFSYSDLAGAYLLGASFLGANFSQADLTNAELNNAILRRADFNGADLSHTHLLGADFSNSSLVCAKLTFAILNFTCLDKTNFSEAIIEFTSFDDCDLSSAIGLDAATQDYPSTIGINTLSKSGGKIPEVFLRGCGLSDWQIENAKLFNPDLSNDEFINIQYRIRELRFTQTVQIKPLFISYSHSDGSFVNSIEPHLNKRGIRFWRDIHHATSGKLERQINQAIRSHPIVLLILSANSVESDWVQHEARLARKLEQETKSDVLCPIALDDSWKTCDWPERLREQIMEYNVLDFSQWQDQTAFDRMFARLIEGLGIFYK